MKIVEIRDAVVPIASQIRNAFIDFSKMTASVVAVVTDVVRDGNPLSATVSTRMDATRRAVSCASGSCRG